MFILSILTISFAQDTTLTKLQQSEIKVTAFTSQQEVPVNRTVRYIIQVEWLGELDNYEISEVETPELRNFKIIKTSSADRRESIDGTLKAIKTFEFELQPEELGMGYIEGVIVRYIDKITGDGKHLVTNRLQVKVIDPIPEPGSRNWIYWLIVGLLLSMAVAIGLYLLQKKRLAARRAQEAMENEEPTGKLLLKELKETVLLNEPSVNFEDGFSKMSWILRRYLEDRYGFDATHALNEEIVQKLKQNAVDDSLINNVVEIFDKCDIVKFSGTGAERSEFERIFTLLEDFIITTLEYKPSIDN